MSTEVSAIYISHCLPVGSILYFTHNRIPKDFLICDGSYKKRDDYPTLFNIIGTTYGGDDENDPDHTLFRLPDLLNKTVEGSSTPGTYKNNNVEFNTDDVDVVSSKALTLVPCIKVSLCVVDDTGVKLETANERYRTNKFNIPIAPAALKNWPEKDTECEINTALENILNSYSSNVSSIDLSPVYNRLDGHDSSISTINTNLTNLTNRFNSLVIPTSTSSEIVYKQNASTRIGTWIDNRPVMLYTWKGTTPAYVSADKWGVKTITHNCNIDVLVDITYTIYGPTTASSKYWYSYECVDHNPAGSGRPNYASIWVYLNSLQIKIFQSEMGNCPAVIIMYYVPKS